VSVALRHIGIVVSDLEKAVKLYQDYLGCELMVDLPGLTGAFHEKLVGIKKVIMNVAILRTKDDNRIELLEYKNCLGKKRDPILSNDVGASHFALTVENIDKLYESRKDFGVSFISEPLLSPDGYVKLAYAILMDECIVELVEVLDERAKFSGGQNKEI
jgi:catechol 2,3-dioxygenase-like lactoylglutathione lyase family enzyme